MSYSSSCSLFHGYAYHCCTRSIPVQSVCSIRYRVTMGLGMVQDARDASLEQLPVGKKTKPVACPIVSNRKRRTCQGQRGHSSSSAVRMRNHGAQQQRKHSEATQEPLLMVEVEQDANNFNPEHFVVCNDAGRCMASLLCSAFFGRFSVKCGEITLLSFSV